MSDPYYNAEAGPSSYQTPQAQSTFPTLQPNTSGPSSINLNSPTPSLTNQEYTNDPPRPILKIGIPRTAIPPLPTRTTRPAAARGNRGGPSNTRGRSSTRISTRQDSTTGVQKLKLSLSFKNNGEGGSGTGRKTSFLGEYDRDLDENPDEPLTFEEQFILRVPKEVADGPGSLREMVKGNVKGLEGVEFKFLDSRRAAFKINGVTYSSKLVDLPCIVESQKTHDKSHLFKVADISQMLVVEKPVKEEAAITAGSLKVDEYVWPHGLTPPLRHVRKRRFRKRVSRRTIEVVEEQVEDLLKKDQEAESTSYDLLDIGPDPDAPDSYYEHYDPNATWDQHEMGSEFGGSEMYDDPGSVAASQMEDWGEDGGEGGDGGDDDGAFDEELAQALMEQLEEGSEASEEEALSASEDDDDDEGEKSEDDEETLEMKAKIRQFTSEIKALEGAVEKKRAGFTGGNPIMMKRFEETIAGLQGDIQTKISARQILVDSLEERNQPKTALPTAELLSAQDTPGGTGTPAAGTPMEVDDPASASYYDEAPTPTPPIATPTAGPSPAINEYDGEDDDDLFGDAESEVTGVDMPTPDQVNELGDDGDGDGDEEEEEDEEDEMAALLRAELGGEENEVVPDMEEQLQADAAAALDDFAFFGGLEDEQGASSPMGHGEDDFVDLGGLVEGGAGMRRYVDGAEGEDDSSEDSDD